MCEVERYPHFGDRGEYMGRRAHLPDTDPDETGEWLEALRDVAGNSGVSRARILLHEILGEASDLGVPISPISRTPYLNTIPRENEGPIQGMRSRGSSFKTMYYGMRLP